MGDQSRILIETEQVSNSMSSRHMIPRLLVLADLRLKGTSEEQKEGLEMTPVTLKHGDHASLFGQESICTLRDPENGTPIECKFNVAPREWPRQLVQQVPSLTQLAAMEAMLRYMVNALECDPALSERLNKRLQNNEKIGEILAETFPVSIVTDQN